MRVLLSFAIAVLLVAGALADTGLCPGKYILGPGQHHEDYGFNNFHLNAMAQSKNDQLMSGVSIGAPVFVSGYWNPNTGTLDVELEMTSPYIDPTLGLNILSGSPVRVFSSNMLPVPNDPMFTVTGSIDSKFYDSGNGPVVWNNVFFAPEMYMMGMEMMSSTPNSYQNGALTLWGSQGWNATEQNFDEIGPLRMGVDLRFALLDCVPDVPSCPTSPCVLPTDCSTYLSTVWRSVDFSDPFPAPVRGCTDGACSITEFTDCPTLQAHNQIVFDMNPMLSALDTGVIGAFKYGAGTGAYVLNVGGLRVNGLSNTNLHTDGLNVIVNSVSNTVSITGTVVAPNNANALFTLTLNFSGKVASSSNQRVEPGASTADWSYYTVGVGSLVGQAGSLAAGFSADLALQSTSVLQLGTGAIYQVGFVSVWGASAVLSVGTVTGSSNSGVSLSTGQVAKLDTRLAHQCLVTENCDALIIPGCCDTQYTVNYTPGLHQTWSSTSSENCFAVNFS